MPLSDLKPAPWNPRIIRDERFKMLCASLKDDPEFLKLRPVLATLDGTIYAGNMRYRAAEHLGWTEIPAILTETDDKTAKERALRDNASFGEWQWDELSTLMDELEKLGTDIDALGIEVPKVEDVEDEKPSKTASDEKPQVECPECGHSFVP